MKRNILKVVGELGRENPCTVFITGLFVIIHQEKPSYLGKKKKKTMTAAEAQRSGFRLTGCKMLSPPSSFVKWNNHRTTLTGGEN